MKPYFFPRCLVLLGLVCGLIQAGPVWSAPNDSASAQDTLSDAENSAREEVRKRQRRRLLRLAKGNSRALLHHGLQQRQGAAMLLEGALALLRADRQFAKNPYHTTETLRTVVRYSRWPRVEGVSTLQTVTRLAKEANDNARCAELHEIQEEYLQTEPPSPFPYDWRSEREFWLQFAADLIDGVHTGAADMWPQKAASDSANATLYRHAYLASAEATNPPTFNVDFVAPLSKHDEPMLAICHAARMLTVAANCGVRSENERIRKIRDRLLAQIQHPDFAAQRASDECLWLFSEYYRSLKQEPVDRLACFDTLLNRLSPYSFQRFCQMSGVSPEETFDAFLRKHVVFHKGARRIDAALSELADQVAVPLWMHDRVYQQAATIDFAKGEQGTWLKVMQTVLESTSFQLAVLDDVMWVGPSEELDNARKTYRRSRSRLPAPGGQIGNLLREPTAGLFQQTPLIDIAEYLQELHQTLVFLCESQQVAPNMRLTIRNHSLPLHLGLTNISAKLPRGEWTAINGAIIIGQREDIAQWKEEEARHLRKVARLKRASGKAAQAILQPTTMEFSQTLLPQCVQHWQTLHDVEFEFAGDAEVVEKCKQLAVTENYRGISLGWAMTLVLHPLGLEWDASGDTIFIRERAESDDENM